MYNNPQCDKKVSPHTLGKPRTKEEVLRQIARIETTQSEASKRSLRTKYGVKEGYNPLFKLSIDPFR